jgi:tetratricopeptide (TPR) repeat protein
MNLILILLTSLFTQANTQYAEGNYAEAAAQYEQILADHPSADVYYNLGNAYFKQNELAQSILAYERALQIDPSHKDAKYNLQFAQSYIKGQIKQNNEIDNEHRIKNTPSFLIAKWLKPIRDALNLQTWMIISIALFISTLICLLLFAFSNTVWIRKTTFYTSIVALLFSIMAIANAASLHKQEKTPRESQRKEAIITQGIVNALSAPDSSGKKLFPLYEGIKVEIIETNGDWCRIHVSDLTGWILAAHLERI